MKKWIVLLFLISSFSYAAEAQPPKAMAEAFAVVLEEFRDVTLKDSAVLESVGRQVHGVTGGQMQEFAQRLRDAAPRPLTGQTIAIDSGRYFH